MIIAATAITMPIICRTVGISRNTTIAISEGTITPSFMNTEDSMTPFLPILNFISTNAER